VIGRLLGASLSEVALITYAVTNIGWIDIVPRAKGMHVRCRPSLVTEPALGSLLYVLCDAEGSVLLTVLARDWQHVILRDRRELSTVLAALAGTSESQLSCIRERHLSREIRPERSPLFLATQAVIQATETNTSLATFEPMLDTLFGGRWTISHSESESEDVVFDAIGRGFTPFNPTWSALRSGSRLSDCGDTDYARWIAVYRSNISGLDRPVFDEVDALVRLPVGETRMRYSRVTLPLRLPGCDGLVFSASVADHSIDLREAC
jgi:hypothetical protein